MKNIITGVACFIVLAVFMVQFTANEVTHSKMLFVENKINASMEEAKQEGCITTAIESALKADIAAKVKCNQSEVVIAGTKTAVLRGEKITYSVTYPLKGVIGARSILGVTDDQATLDHVIAGTVISEYVGR